MRLIRLLCLLVVSLVTSAAIAQTDATITYQGVLLDNGVPANGTYGIYFRLWDSETGGTAVGLGRAVILPVVDGKFSVELDWGAEFFDGSDRWLELFVGGNTLTPRQPITHAPYAIQTRGMVIGDEGNVLFHSLSQVEGTVTFTSPGGIDLILNADTNDIGEDQNARVVMKQDGGQVVARVGYREGANDLEIMQEYDGDLVLGTNNEDRLTISSVGNVSIGTDLPVVRLHVKQDISNRGIRTEHESTPDYWDTGIGVLTNNYKFFYNNLWRGDVSSVDGAFISSSDRRLKRDTQPIPPVLEKVSQLLPATYLYKDNPEDTPRSFGFIAQDVEPLFPDLVRESDDGTKGLVYDGFAVISIKAIQELKQENNGLRARLDALEQIVAQLSPDNK